MTLNKKKKSIEWVFECVKKKKKINDVPYRHDNEGHF